MLAKSKFNSIETLMSKTLSDMDISHEELIAIFNEKDKYEKMKENVKNISGKLKKEKQKNNVNLRQQVCKLLNIYIFMMIMIIILNIIMIFTIMVIIMMKYLEKNLIVWFVGQINKDFQNKNTTAKIVFSS